MKLQALELKVPFGDFPGQNVRPGDGDLVWVIDTAAAAHLAVWRGLQALI
jgi:hypothetical protein